jgi:hypothetical protein
MNRVLQVLAFVFFALTSARADMVYDTCLVAPGYINGTGNSNCHFTELTTTYGDGSITLALGVVLRYVGPVAPLSSTNDYTVPVGNAPVTHSGSAWGFPFSITTSGDLVVGDFTYLLTVQDLTLGTTGTLTPATLGDNTYYTPSGGKTSTENLAIDTLLQNSEALMYPPLSTDLNYNSYNPDTYRITLTATPAVGSEVTMFENVDAETPEPAAMGMIAAGLLGLLFAVRQRQR